MVRSTIGKMIQRDFYNTWDKLHKFHTFTHTLTPVSTTVTNLLVIAGSSYF